MTGFGRRRLARGCILVLVVAATLGFAPPSRPLSSFDLKDEVFVRSDGCAALPTDPALDPFCDVAAVGSDAGWHCSGALIAPGFVLTAGHCLPVTRVAFGHNVRTPIHIAAVTAAFRAPLGDAAIVAVDDTPGIAPHDLRTEDRAPRGRLRAIGFGSPDGSQQGVDKRGVWLRTDGYWGCDAARSFATGCTTGLELVAWGGGAKDTCGGDSGGPLFELVGTRWTLIGVVSRPIRNAQSACGDGGVYVRVDALASWITGIVGDGS